jgi:hypothetical protein
VIKLKSIRDGLLGLGHVELFNNPLDAHQILDGINHHHSAGAWVGTYMAGLTNQRADDLNHL